VIDPFGGSGTSLIDCERTGRQARLIELDPRYCDVIVKRWQEQTGRAAMLEGDGRSFDDISAGSKAAA
jgi:DNA modification methylase